MKIVFEKTIYICNCSKIAQSGVIKKDMPKNTKTILNQHSESSCPVAALITKVYRNKLNKEPFF